MTITPTRLSAVRFIEELDTGGTRTRTPKQAMTRQGSNGYKMRDRIEMRLNARRRSICRSIANLQHLDVSI